MDLVTNWMMDLLTDLLAYLPTIPFAVNGFLSFGLLLLIGACGGYLSHRLPWLPSITAFMLLGYLLGPSGLQFLSSEMMGYSKLITDIALGLILYRLGLSLDLRTALQNRSLWVVSLVESIATFVIVFFALSYLHIDPVASALIAAIAISSSPAVLIHVAHEVKAKGFVTENTKTLVALNNVWSFLMFSAVAPFMHWQEGAPWQAMILQPTYRLFGSIVVAIILGWGLGRLVQTSRQVPQYWLAIVASAIMLALGISQALNLSLLMTTLVLGIVVRTSEQEDPISKLEFGAVFELFFLALFVLAGANLHLGELIHYGPYALAFVLARSLAKWLGTFATAKIFQLPNHHAASTGLLLVPMAGMAIGLVRTTQTIFPQSAEIVGAIVFASVAVFETVGPPLATWAFKIAKEHGMALAADTHASKTDLSIPATSVGHSH